MFQGRTILIVTKHAKEEVLAPLLESSLGVHCIVASEYDTDRLGTFTGEVEREDDPLATVRRKCHEGMALYNYDLAIASEGSFGAHPSIFIAPADDELVMFVDAANNLEITARELSLETNFCGMKINSQPELNTFLQRARFPSHAVIIRKSEDSNEGLVKGIAHPEMLESIAQDYFQRYGSFFAETDMRAHNNPARMLVIAAAAEKLIQKIKSLCPDCGTPGFGVTDVKAGLPCELCRWPTASTLSHINRCSKCSFTKEIIHPYGKSHEDPMYCNICNP